LTGGAPDLKASFFVFLAPPECAGEWVIVNDSFRDGRRDDEEWVGGGCGGVNISTKVAEGEVEVAIGVEVREKKGMVMKEGRARRKDESGF